MRASKTKYIQRRGAPLNPQRKKGKLLMNIYQNLNVIESMKEEATKNAGARLESIREFIESDVEGYSLNEKIQHLEEVTTYGGASGVITSLISYFENLAFVFLYLDEVEEALEAVGMNFKEFLEDGETISNGLNRLAWFVYELEAGRLLEELKDEKEGLEADKLETIDDIKAGLGEVLGNEPWDLTFKYSEGLTIQLNTTAADFIDAQDDKGQDVEKVAKMKEVATKYGLYFEVFENYSNSHGFDKMDFTLRNREDVAVYSKRALLDSWRNTVAHSNRYDNAEGLTKEDKETLEGLAEWFNSVLYEAIEEADEALRNFFDDRCLDYWDEIN